jgi:hypothetical protein
MRYVSSQMIETWDRFTQFVNENMQSDLLLHVIPLHDSIHSAINPPCLLFIRSLTLGKTYYYGFDHPDVKTPTPVNHTQMIDMLSRIGKTKWVIDKKSFLHMVPVENLLDIGMAEHNRSNQTFDLSEFETNAHTLIRRNFNLKPGYGKFVPLIKHLETFSELVETCEKIIKSAPIDDAFLKFNKLIIEPLTEVERHGLAIDRNAYWEHFGDTFHTSDRVYTQYNFYTSTGRPSNRFGGINYAALNKEDGSRKAFVSRFGSSGKLVLMDYSTFHPRIISLLTDYPIPTSVDIYEYLAKLYFNKPVIDEGDIADAKQITFRQFFGGVEEKYQHIKYLSHMKDFIDSNWRHFNEHGYVETPIFKRRITDKHVQQPKPATVFNYIMQAVEGEISIPVLGDLNKFLANKKTQAVLYTYDSILFDYCLDDGLDLGEVRELMSIEGKFPTKVYVGDNYQDMELVS